MTWIEHAACRGTAPETTDIFFPEESHITTDTIYDTAKRWCKTCLVRQQCLDDAMMYEQDQWRRFGVFGGLTPRQRDQLARTWQPPHKR